MPVFLSRKKGANMAEPSRYTRTAILLHWLIAALIITNVLLIWTVDLWPEGMARPVINTHKSIGITVLGLALLRWLWRFGHAPPPLPVSYKPWENIASRLVHAGFYVLILALPLSGWAHDSAWKAAAANPFSLYGVIPFPRMSFIMSLDPAIKEHLHTLLGTLHTLFAYVLYAALTLHVGAALKHQFIDREAELQRMLPAARISARAGN
jgi:cytochrome b561